MHRCPAIHDFFAIIMENPVISLQAHLSFDVPPPPPSFFFFFSFVIVIFFLLFFFFFFSFQHGHCYVVFLRFLCFCFCFVRSRLPVYDRLDGLEATESASRAGTSRFKSRPSYIGDLTVENLGGRPFVGNLSSRLLHDLYSELGAETVKVV